MWKTHSEISDYEIRENPNFLIYHAEGDSIPPLLLVKEDGEMLFLGIILVQFSSGKLQISG